MIVEHGARCLFCGGDASEPDHLTRCDGRQGFIDAGMAEEARARTLVRRTDSATSFAAAVQIVPIRTTLQKRVYAALRAHGPLTDDALLHVPELAGLGPSTIRTRRAELTQLGWVRASGLTTNKGRRVVTIWVAVEA